MLSTFNTLVEIQKRTREGGVWRLSDVFQGV